MAGIDLRSTWHSWFILQNVAFLHWRSNCAGSKKNRRMACFFSSGNYAQRHGNMGIIYYKLGYGFLWVDHMINQWTGHLLPLPVLFTRIPSVQHSFDKVVNAQKTFAEWTNKWKKWLKLNHSGSIPFSNCRFPLKRIFSVLNFFYTF